MQMAHMGAEVIRIESQKRTCVSRAIPSFADDIPGPNRAGYFNQYNQGKKSLQLDLARPEAVEIAKKLVAKSDIVVQNFSAGAIDRMGLGYETLKKAKPDIIMISICGYGQTGPERQFMGYGPASVPLAGISSLTGYRGLGPAEVGISYGDPNAGIFGAFAALAALAYRQRTGKGVHVDLALWEALLVLMPEGLIDYAMNRTQPERDGNRDRWMAPHGVYPAAGEQFFNRFVPGAQTNPLTGQPYGKWDYNHDGVQDTIFVPGCGRQGCHVLYSDTIAGGFGNNFGNVFNTVTAGPFPLKAGDTTQFLWAFTFARDSAEMRQAMTGLTTAYFTNYQGPTPFTYPQLAVGKSYFIESAQLIDSTRFGIAGASVGTRITFRYPQINPVDAYFLQQVQKLRADSAAGDALVRRITRLNPGLLARLQARANDNLSGVYVFKSCDGGNTFTTTSGNSGTCTTSPTRTIDGGAIAFPWRPWPNGCFASRGLSARFIPYSSRSSFTVSTSE
jgi:hypothetical protein